MKFLSLIAGLVLVGVSAQAQDYGLGSYLSNLHSVTLDPGFHHSVGSIERVKRGSVVIDYDTREVVLTLIRDYYCRAPRACALVMPSPITVHAEIQAHHTDRCGAYTVIARDFALLTPYIPSVANTITVTDMRNNRCPHLTYRPYAPTEVTLERSFDYVDEGFVERVDTVSTMSGDDLVRVK